jgi:hypothetical protein
VNAGAASRLTIQTQPSAAATAGVIFARQPVIRVEDAFGNLCTGDNNTVVTAARNAGSGILQGTLTATAINGIATFANLSHSFATTINLSFTHQRANATWHCCRQPGGRSKTQLPCRARPRAGHGSGQYRLSHHSHRRHRL